MKNNNWLNSSISIQTNYSRFFLICLFGIFFVTLLRTAWISDDALITLRTVLNFIHGYGPVFNVGERVQAYTHPLWFLLISSISFLTKNVFLTTIIVSFAMTFLTLILLVKKISTNLSISFIALIILLLSRAFIDYSTSGLENPLSHFLIVISVYYALKIDDNNCNDSDAPRDKSDTQVEITK